MIRTLQAAYEFARQNDAPTLWSAVIRKDAHPLIQFLKYSLCGFFAVVIYQATFGILGQTVFPHFEGMTRGDELVSLEQRKLYFVLASAAAFLLADVFAYVANLLWVFQGGRHHRVVEFLLFTGVATIGWIAGMIPGYLAFGAAHAGSWVSSGIVTITSALVNYICRKLVIFKH
jgi:putative flippase GtrA